LEELLTVFLGPQNVSHIPLQSLDMDRFQKAELFGKLANAYADIPSSALTRTGTFKALVGGDRVTAQKKFRDPFSFKNYAKLVFSCNKVPEVGDDSTAFFRRWVILNFPFKFEGDRDDKNIMEKLTKKEELSGLFNLAVKGLERLLRNGGFSRTPSTDEVRRTWQRMASSVSCFREDMLVVDSDKWVTKEEMYLRYVGYCRKEKIPAVAKNTFGTKLPEYIKRFMKDGRGSPMAERGSGGE
jgi:putative DNA primase/helicase